MFCAFLLINLVNYAGTEVTTDAVVCDSTSLLVNKVRVQANIMWNSRNNGLELQVV